MDFERADGVIVRVSQNGEDLKLLRINLPRRGSACTVSKTEELITHSKLLEASDLPPESSLHDHCSRALEKLIFHEEHDMRDKRDDIRPSVPRIYPPKYVESTPLNELVARIMKGYENKDELYHVEQRREESFANMLARRTKRTVERVCWLRTKFEESLRDREMLDKEGELNFRKMQDKCLVEDGAAEYSNELEQQRCKNIGFKLKNRALREIQEFKDIFSLAARNALARESVVHKWKETCRARKKDSNLLRLHTSVLQNKREMNIKLQGEKSTLRGKKYVLELREQRKQIERKSKIRMEKRQALVFELFHRSVN
jgi:hypothetical protein